MRRSWSDKRKWECTKAESNFEKLLTDNGYEIKAYKESWSKTDFKIAKDGIEIEYTVSSDMKDYKHAFKCFEDYYNLTKECLQLRKALSETRGGKAK